MEMELATSLEDRIRAHLMALASTWRGKVVFTLREQANTSSPLQVLSITAIKENLGPTAPSTLIFKANLSGGDNFREEDSVVIG